MSRSFTRSILLLTLLAAACTDTPTTLPPDGAAGVSAARMGTNPPGQVQQIEALLSSWEAAWGDASAYASHYAEDAEIINPVGGILSGREAFRQQHVFLFNGPFAGSTQMSEVRRLVFLTGTIAVVDLDVRLTGYVGLPPGLPEFQPGVVFTRMRMVLVKHQGTWEIAAQQMTAVPPAP